jgi:type IV secretion system protein VirB10
MSTPADEVEGSPERTGNPDDQARDEEQSGARRLAGERGIPSVNRVRSMQSRVTTLLAIGCMGLMALGLLGWYYSNALTRHQRLQKAVESKSQQRAQGEMTLPPLGRISPPRVATSAEPSTDASSLDDLLGPRPELPVSYPTRVSAAVPRAYADGAHPTRPKSVEELSLERRLTGAVSSREFVSASNRVIAPTLPNAEHPPGASDAASAASYLASLRAPAASSMAPVHDAGADPAAGDVQTLLRAETTPAVEARVLPTQRFLLPKGAFLDCTLETAIDSTLPGLVTCITATDVFGVDGTTVLIERGSKLFGETRGQVRQGAARVFVLWTEARTPTGVVVALASPGTDELGRSGLPGVVDRHFFDRFGAAMLISILDSAAQTVANRSGSGGTVVLNPAGSQDVLAEVLRSTVNIPPTVRKHQGDRIQVLVARDVDFRSVYDLRAASAR